jgi:hypothetical protein
MIDENALRKQLLYLLRGGGAHIHFDDFIADFPVDLINAQVEGVPYTPWQLLEHMRLAQWDILEFSRDPSHVSPQFPEGYWPPSDRMADAEMWKKSVMSFRADLREMENLVADTSIDLFAQISGGQGETLFRECLLVADHNAYHLGAFALMNRIINRKTD